MKKISTLYKKNPENLGRVIDEINPENEWVINGEGVATRKYDGTACAIINGELYKRYDVKKGKQVPVGAIPCQEPDEITGHWPHWVLCDTNKPEDKYFFDGLKWLMSQRVSGPATINILDGTYELCGEKVQGNPEGIEGHQLIKHGKTILDVKDFSFEGIKEFLYSRHIEGIVFHHPDGRMCKIRKSDFGIHR